MSTVNPDSDLPLMANVEEIRARHYMIKLRVDFSKRVFHGEQLIFLEAINEKPSQDVWRIRNPDLAPKDFDCSLKNPQDDFKCVLDYRDMKFHEVQCVLYENEEEFLSFLSSVEKKSNRQSILEWFQKPRSNLNYSTTKWSIEITKNGCKTSQSFPKVIYLSYVTGFPGHSVAFRKDQSGQDCVFTAAASINNRSLFVSQEPPIAMATWQAEIQAPSDYKVLCTGDQIENDSDLKDDFVNHYFYTQMVLPMSTFAIAIGKWDYLDVIKFDDIKSEFKNNLELPKTELDNSCSHHPYPCHVKRGDSGPLIPCRLFANKTILESIKDNWSTYIKASLEAAHKILGSHPFSRLDILIVPRCFSGLGLASPNLMFLSQSLVLNGDAGMLVRISHEISHSWFGLVIGALDWTEQWLSEGFATFVEDPIHSLAMKIIQRDNPDMKEFLGYPLDLNWELVNQLRANIRFITLSSELENTNEDLQKMRPMLGNELRDEETNTLFVKDGMNPESAYTQVHYIKGYFLLRYLFSLVNEESFFDTLRHYIHDLYHGHLVHSTEFISLFFSRYPKVTEDNHLKFTTNQWLNDAGMGNDLKNQADKEFNESNNDLLKQVREETLWWKSFNEKSLKRTISLPSHEINSRPKLISEQKVILLESLLQSDRKLTKKTLNELNKSLNLSSSNADVQHRFCELIIQCENLKFLHNLKDFLYNHQAMGIYLYGELAMAKSKKFSNLAKETFEQLKEEIDADFATNIEAMI